jgi:hypothetical protein
MVYCGIWNFIILVHSIHHVTWNFVLQGPSGITCTGHVVTSLTYLIHRAPLGHGCGPRTTIWRCCLLRLSDLVEGPSRTLTPRPIRPIRVIRAKDIYIYDYSHCLFSSLPRSSRVLLDTAAADTATLGGIVFVFWGTSGLAAVARTSRPLSMTGRVAGSRWNCEWQVCWMGHMNWASLELIGVCIAEPG